jgi:hypothetical protein
MDKSLFVPSLHAYTQALRALRAAYERTPSRSAFFVDATILEVRNLIQHQKLSYPRAAMTSESEQSDDFERFTLLTMLLKFRDLKATNPLDKVYAPLYLSLGDHDRAQRIPVDYKSSPREIYTRVVICCMQDSEWPFGILELCRFGVAPNLPSWAPDWRTPPRKVLSRDTRTGKQIFCDSKGAFPLASSSDQFSVLENDVLQRKGIRVDALTEVWEPMSQGLKDKTNLSIKTDDIDQTYFVTGEKMSQAYRELVNPNSHRGYPDQGDRNELILLTREQWKSGKEIVGQINRRRIAKTKKGFARLLPAEAQTTDEV